MNEQILKTSDADVLSSKKKLRKTLSGGGIHPPPPLLYVRGLMLQIGRFMLIPFKVLLTILRPCLFRKILVPGRRVTCAHQLTTFTYISL